MNEITSMIRKRRSIFPANYSGERVSDEIIQEMLENANWAPTNKRTEPWRFVVFTEDGLKTLGEQQAEVYKAGSTRLERFNENTYESLKRKPLAASHVIAIIMKRDPEERLPEAEEIAAVACAVQNMHLTATAHGIGAYWGTGGITYLEEAKELFSLEPNDRLMGFFFVGTPKGDWPEGQKGSVEEKVQWVRS